MDRAQGVAPFSLQVDLRQVVYALSASLDLVGIGDVAHGKRVGIMAAECSRELGMSEAERCLLFELGVLHDIGVSSTITHHHLVSFVADPLRSDDATGSVGLFVGVVNAL